MINFNVYAKYWYRVYFANKISSYNLYRNNNSSKRQMFSAVTVPWRFNVWDLKEVAAFRFLWAR